jgi:hypothetical protein
MAGSRNFVSHAWKALLLACCLAYPIVGQGQAASATAQLTITMSLQSSISLIFQNNAAVGSNGFCPLTNAGTNNVGLDLGIAAFPSGSDSLPCVAYAHIGSATYQVSSGFDVMVTKANSSSPNYRLAAEISSAPPANVVWLVNNVTLSNAAFTQLDASDAYGTRVTKTLQVQVKNTVAAQTLQETVTFLATAN